LSSAAARRGVALVIAAPSGAGKSTIARAVLAAETGVEASVSATTRQKRPGERDGIDYHFVNDTKFQALIEGDELLEWATVFGRCYGTKRAPVAAALAAGRDVIFDIDWQGPATRSACSYCHRHWRPYGAGSSAAPATMQRKSNGACRPP